MIEPWAHGHHFSLYLREVLAEALRREWQVHLLTSHEAVVHPAMEDIRRDFDQRFELSLMPAPYQRIRPGGFSLLADQWDYHRAVRAGWQQLAARRFDAVLAMDLDSMDKVIAWLGPPTAGLPLVGILVHPKFHLASAGRNRLKDRLLRAAFWRLLRRPEVAAVCPIDPRLKTMLRDENPRLAEKIVPIVEPALAQAPVARAQARLGLNLPADAQVVLAYGALTRRKGLSELLSALSDAPEDCVLMLAGDPDAGVRELLEAEIARRLLLAGRMRVIDRYVDDAEQACLFAAADVLWLGYAPDFNGQSALLPLAAGHALPVIARAGTTVGGLVQDHRLGLALVPERPQAVRAALQALRSDPELRRATGAGMALFASSRNPRNFAGGICDAVASAFCRRLAA